MRIRIRRSKGMGRDILQIVMALAAVVLIWCGEAVAGKESAVVFRPSSWPEALQARTFSSISIEYAPSARVSHPDAIVTYDLYDAVTPEAPLGEPVATRTGRTNLDEDLVWQEDVRTRSWSAWTLLYALQRRIALPDDNVWRWADGAPGAIFRRRLNVALSDATAVEAVFQDSAPVSNLYLRMAVANRLEIVASFPKEATTSDGRTVYRFDVIAFAQSQGIRLSDLTLVETVMYLNAPPQALIEQGALAGFRVTRAKAASADFRLQPVLSEAPNGLRRLTVEQGSLLPPGHLAVLRQVSVSSDVQVASVTMTNAEATAELALPATSPTARPGSGLLARYAVALATASQIIAAVLLAGIALALGARLLPQRIRSLSDARGIGAVLTLAGVTLVALAAGFQPIAQQLALGCVAALALAAAMAGFRGTVKSGFGEVFPMGRWEPAIPLLMFLAIILGLSWIAPVGMDGVHDGQLLHPAWVVADGGTPLRDTFSLYGVLLTLIQGLTLKIFGARMLVLHESSVVLYAAAAALLYLCWRRILNPGMALFAILVWIALLPVYADGLAPWSSLYGLVLQCVSLLALCRAYEGTSSQYRWVMVSGLCAGLMIHLRMDVGASHLGGVLAAITAMAVVDRTPLYRTLKTLALVLLGFALVWAAVLAYLAINHTFDAWYLQSIRMAATNAAVVQSHMGIGIVEHFTTSLLAITDGYFWFILPLATIGLIFFLWLRHWRGGGLAPQERIVLVVAVAGLSAWSQYFPSAFYAHFFWATSPLLGLFVFAALRFFEGRLGPSRVAIAAAIAVVLAVTMGDTWSRLSQFQSLLTQNDTLVQEPPSLAGMRTSATEARVYGAAYGALRHATDAMPTARIVYPAGPPIYRSFVAGREWSPLINVGADLALRTQPEHMAAMGDYIRQARPIVFAAGEVFVEQGYSASIHLGNGLTVLTPGDRVATGRLGSPAESQRTLLHFLAPFQPMAASIRNARLPPVDLSGDFTLEVLVNPSAANEPEAVIFSTLFAPDYGEGLAIQRLDGRYRVLVGDGDVKRTIRRVLSFDLASGRLSYVAITRHDDAWTVAVDGRVADRARLTTALGGHRNFVVLGNDRGAGHPQAQLNGYLAEIQILSGATPSPAIADKAARLAPGLNRMTLSRSP